MSNNIEFKNSDIYWLRGASRITLGTNSVGTDPAKRGKRITKLEVYHYGSSPTTSLGGYFGNIYIDSVKVFWDGNLSSNYGDNKGGDTLAKPFALSWDVPPSERITKVKLYCRKNSDEETIQGMIFVTDKGTESPIFGKKIVPVSSSNPRRLATEQIMPEKVIEFSNHQLIDFSGSSAVGLTVYRLGFVFSPILEDTGQPQVSPPSPPTPSPTTTYKPGDKVEVLVNGAWVPGEYIDDLGKKFSNMKDSPHKVSYDTGLSKGAKPVSNSEIRPWTGTIKPQVEPRKNPADVKINELENAIIKEVNEMRADPPAYAKKLAKLKNSYKKVDGKWLLTVPDEGDEYIGDDGAKTDHEKWLDETIADLEKSPPLTILKSNDKLRGGADIFASDPGQVNGPDHKDSKGQGAQERANLAGYKGGVNECIPGDQRTAFGTVSQLLIDWKVASRGHRKNLMNKDTKEIGVASNFFPEKQVGQYQYEAYIRTVIQCGYGG